MTAVFWGGGGGAFIGNHVYKVLKVKCSIHVDMNNSYHLNNYYVPNILTLCTSISQLAQEKLPHRSGEVAGQVTKFIILLIWKMSQYM